MLSNSTESNRCPWVDDTRAAILALPRDTRQRDISIATGIPESWLSKFINGKVKSPDIRYVYALHSLYVK